MPSFLQRYLGKAQAEEIGWPDFQAFLAQKLGEHQTLEYKSGEVVLFTSDGKLKYPSDRLETYGVMDVVKAVAGLANAEGGLLVLGVEQKPEKHGNSIIGILPGRVKGVPGKLTREGLENVLTAKIQYPVDGITICPVRPSDRHKSFVYLIDVPQSTRPPHRVNELLYFQRRNFSTEPMLHYQIADLYGRRLGPSLEIEVPMPSPSAVGPGWFTLRPSIRNRGNVVAKYVTVICAINAGDYNIVNIVPGGSDWRVRDDHRAAQFTLGLNAVVYPDTPTTAGELLFGPTGASATDIGLTFYLYAEAMEARTPIVGFTRDVLPPMPEPETPAQQMIREEQEAKDRYEAELDQQS